MRFITKVLAKMQPGTIKPAKANKPNKPVKPTKPAKAQKPNRATKIKPGPAQAATPPTTKGSTNFAHVRQLMGRFAEEMQVTNPFDLNDSSWMKFMKEFAPQLLVALLWDTKHVTESKDRANLLRLFRQRIRA